MKTRFTNWHAIAVAALALGCLSIGSVSARQVWHQGRNVEPKLAACQREKAADHGALTSWVSCMHGQIKPPVGSTTGNAEYWVLRRHCEPKYKLMIKARRAYQSCEARLKSAHRRR
ncbi:MAG: hypothetical protein P8009_09135 [Gammaproteobacteria bacterium]